MDSSKYLRRFFGSQWTKIFGPAFLTFVLLGVGAAIYTGDWNLPLLFGLLLVFFLIRFVFFGAFFFFPVLVVIVVLWASYQLNENRRREKKAAEHSLNDKSSAE